MLKQTRLIAAFFLCPSLSAWAQEEADENPPATADDPSETAPVPEDIAAEPAPDPEPEPAEATTGEVTHVIVIMKGKNELYGTMPWPLAEGWTEAMLTLDGGAEIKLTPDAVENISVQIGTSSQQYRWRNPASSRYLYAPSALPLGKGHSYLSQKELVFTAVATGVSDNVSVLAGSMVPGLILAMTEGTHEPLNGILGMRVSESVGDDLWAGAGFEVFGFSESAFGFGFGNATYGDEHAHITVGSGVGMNLVDAQVEIIPVVVAGTKRVSQSGALVMETWTIIDPDLDYDPVIAAGTGYRFIGKTLTVDLAIVNTFIDGNYFPFPWLDFAWHWGG